MKNKILIHNMTFKGIHVVPGVINYDQRGLVFADSGDIVITSNEVDRDYINYLEKLGYKTNEIEFISPKDNKDKTWSSIFGSFELENYLNNLRNKQDYVIDVYNPTSFDGGLSAKTGIEHCNNCELCEKYGTKSGFRQLCREADLPMAEGMENLKTVEEVKTALGQIFDKGFNKAVIKVDDGISGYGNSIVTSNEFEKDANLVDELFFEKYLKPIRWDIVGVGVVEGWIDNVINSLSVLVKVDGNEYHVYCLQDQLLIDGDKWAGCYSPSELCRDSETMEKLNEIIRKSSNYLIKSGFWGFYSFDVVETKNKDLYLIEANMRKIGSFYPRVLVNKVVGDNDYKCYVSSDYMNSAKWKGKKFQDVYERLIPWLYKITLANEGVLLYNIGGLEQAGRFDFVVVADNLDKAKEIRSIVIDLLDEE